MSNKKDSVSFGTPFKKDQADERPTDYKEGENEHEQQEHAEREGDN